MIYTFCKNFCYLLARLILRFQAYHVERVPATGGGVLVANHASYMDPPLSGIALRRKLYFFARDSLMKSRFSKWFLRQLRCISVNRDQMDLSTFRTVVDLIKTGEMVVIFPEGTRSPDGSLQEGKIGTGMIIKHSDARVIPCYISGAAQALPRGSFFPRPKKVRVIYGHPIDFSTVEIPGDKKEVYAEITQRIMQAIAALKEELEQELGVAKQPK